MKTKSKYIFICSCLISMLATSCGYQMANTPYNIKHPITINIPMAVNNSQFGELGPLLTRYMVETLTASPNITVTQQSGNKLTLIITKAVIKGGSWKVAFPYQSGSSSRAINITIEATLETQATDKQAAKVDKKVFVGERAYMVTDQQGENDLYQLKASEELVKELSNKIAQSLFSDF